MKKVQWIALFFIVIVLLATHQAYSSYSDKKLMENTNEQLKSLFEPFINNTVVVIDEDKYLLRIKEASLGDYVETYKNKYSDLAYIKFDIYKNEVSENNLIDTDSFHMEVWRKNLNSDFFTTGKSHFGDMSYKVKIFQGITQMIFEDLYKPIEKARLNQELESGYNSSRGHGRYNEDEIKLNNYGEITTKGKVHYETITYAKDLSMKFATTFYIEDFQKYNEMHIKVKKSEGDYHALWDMNVNDFEKVTFYYDGNYEGKKTITKKETIEKLVIYLKTMPFEKKEEQARDYESYSYITLGDNDYNVTLSKEAVYTNSGHALCEGENYVKELIRILEEDN